MASSDRELEEQLMEAGNRLLDPLSSVDELLSILDQVESCLSRVEQSPSKSMQNALCPSMKALVANELLRHLDTDVKVAVASCISEITRITAPDAPYDDEQMKEIFQLIVGAFEELSNMSSRSYSKRVSILETVAKVRSCVVMLDLECDALILEMFQHFQKAIRDNHPDNVFSSMETIMTLVLEESEDISLELLSLLLASVAKENHDVLSIARKLGERVIENCAAKLKPYLRQAVQSMGISLNDYSKIVASICQEACDTVEHNDANASDEHLMDKVLAPDAACPGEVDPAVDDGPPKSVTSNGTSQTGKDGSLVDHCGRTNESKSTNATIGAELDSLDSAKLVKSETKPEHSSKRRGRKPKSSVNSTETSDHSRIDSEKEAAELPHRRKSRSKEVDSSLSEDPSVKEAAVPSEHEKETETQLSSPTASHYETVDVASPSQSQSLPDGSRPKRGRWGTKKGSVDQEADPGYPSLPKGDLLSDQIKDEAPPSANVISKKESEGTSDSEAKPRRRSGKKALTGNTNEEKTPAPKDVLKKEVGVTIDSEAKPLKQSAKKVNLGSMNVDESSAKQQEGKTRRGRGKTEGSGNKEMVSSPKSATKISNKDEPHMEETPKTKSKIKRTPGKEEASKTPHSGKELGETLVGSKIKVWWPKDKMFYEGVIESFDPVKKKHKVLYVDGEDELLILRKERWEFVGDDTLPDEEQATDLPSPDASEMHQKKKAKTYSDSSTKQANTDASSKRGGGTSDRKSKTEVTKSGGKSKDDGKHGRKSKDEIFKIMDKLNDDSGSKSRDDTRKTSSKLKDDAHKPTGKSKDDTPKTSSKAKDDTPKTATKFKSETPKSGSKSNANGTAKGKSGSSKVQESKDVSKGELSDSSKALDGETKSGKKRKRRVNC